MIQTSHDARASIGAWVTGSVMMMAFKHAHYGHTPERRSPAIVHRAALRDDDDDLDDDDDDEDDEDDDDDDDRRGSTRCVARDVARRRASTTRADDRGGVVFQSRWTRASGRR